MSLNHLPLIYGINTDTLFYRSLSRQILFFMTNRASKTPSSWSNLELTHRGRVQEDHSTSVNSWPLRHSRLLYWPLPGRRFEWVYRHPPVTREWGSWKHVMTEFCTVNKTGSCLLLSLSLVVSTFYSKNIGLEFSLWRWDDIRNCFPVIQVGCKFPSLKVFPHLWSSVSRNLR